MSDGQHYYLKQLAIYILVNLSKSAQGYFIIYLGTGHTNIKGNNKEEKAAKKMHTLATYKFL